MSADRKRPGADRGIQHHTAIADQIGCGGGLGQRAFADDHDKANNAASAAVEGPVYAGGDEPIQATARISDGVDPASRNATGSARPGRGPGDPRRPGVGFTEGEILTDLDRYEEIATAAIDLLQDLIDAIAIARQITEDAIAEIRI